MIDKTPAQKIVNYLDTNFRLFEVFWQQTHPEERDEIIQEMAEIIDEHIEFNYR